MWKWTNPGVEQAKKGGQVALSSKRGRKECDPQSKPTCSCICQIADTAIMSDVSVLKWIGIDIR